MNIWVSNEQKALTFRKILMTAEKIPNITAWVHGALHATWKYVFRRCVLRWGVWDANVSLLFSQLLLLFIIISNNQLLTIGYLK